MSIAILSALPQEQYGLVQLLQAPETICHAGRTFVRGQLATQPTQAIILALTGIGKVAATTTATALIEHFGVDQLLFTGVAGGIGSGKAGDVRVGDIVVAQHFVQHDFDARPLLPRWHIPGYTAPLFACDATMTHALLAAAQHCVLAAHEWNLSLLAQRLPQVHAGLIASGDQFIVSAQTCANLRDDFADAGYNALAVEMEGAAIAQVCADYGVPFAAVRTISDRADESAHVDFCAFVDTVASRYAQHIVTQWLKITATTSHGISSATHVCENTA